VTVSPLSFIKNRTNFMMCEGVCGVVLVCALLCLCDLTRSGLEGGQ
jgi:hypothetical protein